MAVVLVLLPSTSSDRPLLAVGAVLVVVLIAGMLLLPWARLPDWCQGLPALTGFAVIALIRHGGGGSTSGYAPLVVVVVLWLAIYGSRTQLRLAIVGTAVTFFGPLILVVRRCIRLVDGVSR